MKIFLASFLEPHNFGPGRVIGIANGSKPKHLECDTVFEDLIPNPDISQEYQRLSYTNRKKASNYFVTEFSKQLELFFDDVIKESQESGQTPQELLPFKCGDTLASWERADYTNYRRLIAPYLEKLGYEIIKN